MENQNVTIEDMGFITLSQISTLQDLMKSFKVYHLSTNKHKQLVVRFEDEQGKYCNIICRNGTISPKN